MKNYMTHECITGTVVSILMSDCGKKFTSRIESPATPRLPAEIQEKNHRTLHAAERRLSPIIKRDMKSRHYIEHG